jgi:hypothetical protein
MILASDSSAGPLLAWLRERTEVFAAGTCRIPGSERLPEAHVPSRVPRLQWQDVATEIVDEIPVGTP